MHGTANRVSSWQMMQSEMKGSEPVRKLRVGRPRKLTPARVEAELPPLTNLDSAMRRLDKLGIWLAQGHLPGSVGGAAVRSVDVWVRAHESKLTQQVATELRDRLDELEAQVKRQRVRAV